MNSAQSSPVTSAQGFVATQWSVVLRAARDSSEQSASALDEICRAYWPPLYAFLRRNGHSPPDAQDLTQSFFAALLEKEFLKDVHPDKGRFRSFMLAALKHFAANERDKAQALKRGGGLKFQPLDFDDAETRYCAEATRQLSPDRLFERAWAFTLLDRVLKRLQNEYVASGKNELHTMLKDSVLGGKNSQTYEEIAQKLGTSEGAVKVAAHRMRTRYRELLREEIAATVTDSKEIDDELRHLFSVIAG